MSSIVTSQPLQCPFALLISTFRRTLVSKEELALFSRLVHKNWWCTHKRVANPASFMIVVEVFNFSKKAQA